MNSFKMFDRIAPIYDITNTIMSLGFDAYWRKKVCQLADTGSNGQLIKVLDLATGTGKQAIAFAKSNKSADIIGVDLSSKMLEKGIQTVKRIGIAERVKFKVGDGTKLDFLDNQFDVVTMSFGIRNFYDPIKGLKEIGRVLRPEGKVLILEISRPHGFLKLPYLLYLRLIVPLIGKITSKDKGAYKYLNKTIEQFPASKKFAETLSKNGFSEVEFQTLTLGVVTIYSGKKINSSSFV